MVDWTKSMQQSFEYYVVDPTTWKDTKKLTTVKSCTITRDSNTDTLGSATIDIDESIGECYIRVYLITIQNGISERHPLGTFLVQTPSSKFDGKTRNVTMDAYTPLIELKEKQPPLGYYVPKTTGDGAYPHRKVLRHENEETKEVSYIRTTEMVNFPTGKLQIDIRTTTGDEIYLHEDSFGEKTYYCVTDKFMDLAYRLTRENLRAPVIRAENSSPLNIDFVADVNDTWFTFLRDLISNANYIFELDEMGRVLYAPVQDIASLQPVWTYTDDNSSILYPELTMDHDLYGIPNVVEVIYYGNGIHLYSRIVNDDENSPTSTVKRGREIIYRVADPDLTGVPDQDIIDQYAEQLLRNLSSVEYSLTYTHGYCPVRLNDCVRLNYSRAGLENIKAKVISQTIKCEPGCPVTEKVIYSNKLWR